MRDLNLGINRSMVYRVFKTLEELGLIIPEKHKKDVFFYRMFYVNSPNFR